MPTPASTPTTRPAAARTDRYWNPTHGPGTLTSPPGKLGGVWASDSGATFTLDVVESKLGRPGKKMTGPRGRGFEEQSWRTLTLRSGETFMLRDTPPPEEP